jgi:hypothetical protein
VAGEEGVVEIVETKGKLIDCSADAHINMIDRKQTC